MKDCHLGVDPWNCSSLLNPGASLNQTLLVTSLQEDLTHVDPTAGKKRLWYWNHTRTSNCVWCCNNVSNKCQGKTVNFSLLWQVNFEFYPVAVSLRKMCCTFVIICCIFALKVSMTSMYCTAFSERDPSESILCLGTRKSQIRPYRVEELPETLYCWYHFPTFEQSWEQGYNKMLCLYNKTASLWELFR